MNEKLILGLIAAGLVITGCLLVALSPAFWLHDYLTSRRDPDKKLRDAAQLVHLKRGSLGT